MAEAMIGSVGALVILALVFASFLALLPLLIGGVSVLATFHCADRSRRRDRLLAAGGQPLARGAGGGPQ